MRRMPLNSMMTVALPTHSSFPPKGVITGFSDDFAYDNGASSSETSKHGPRDAGKVRVKLVVIFPRLCVAVRQW